MKKSGISVLMALGLAACSKNDAVDPPNPITKPTFPFEAQYNIHNLQISQAYEDTAESRGKISSITEASGLARSINNPPYLWVHEDSGNDNLLFLINRSHGEVVATYRITGATNDDWEDIAIGPGPVNGANYLYIGDIGDNNATKTTRKIYRLEEPIYFPADSGKTIDIALENTITFAYPDSARDAESLMIDPLTGDLFVISKREARVRLYRAAWPQPTSETDTLQFIGSFPFAYAVAADVSPDGNRVLIKTYDSILLWEKSGNEDLIELLAATPVRLPYQPGEIQGESICWDGAGSYFTLSEQFAGIVPSLYYYGKK